MIILNKIYAIFFSEISKKKIEKIILYIALIGLFVHLTLIYLSKINIINIHLESELFNNSISSIYTPFSFILIYEVYLLIYYLPKSFTTYITKQYEIITLIIIRKLFKDLSGLELTSNWFEVKGDLQFTYDILASIILFYLIFQFQKQGMIKVKKPKNKETKIERFINRKKIIAVALVPIFLIMALITLFSWMSNISLASNTIPDFETINNLFFDEFFTVLILVDVVLLLISFFYTDKFHKIIRNSGFVVSTILIRMSFGVNGLVSTVLIISAVLFGLAIILIHNKFEKSTLTDHT
ncbi:hypothetical protein [Winogradskyella sp. PG-2]|uniref:hypothetical protein n=1 Tax=Winogradskyella sp. PG-2 TaxID=754409 RepID=UPI0004585E58|nr:hypothetical protein [Winogradskyella sp. PG-2]BAO76925.1 membrane protein, putative [Winogradskyella sp. PG-2]